MSDSQIGIIKRIERKRTRNIKKSLLKYIMKNNKITVKGSEISILHIDKEDYISLTDIARHKDPDRTDFIIQNWLRNRNTVELLGFWEQLYNPDFKPVEFEGFKIIINKLMIFKSGINKLKFKGIEL